MWRRWRGKQAEYKNTLNDDEKLTNKPNPPLPMTAQANCCSPLKRGQRWRLPSALELNSWIPVWIQVPWPLQGRDSGLWDRCRLFIFFINLLHMIIYTGLCGRQQSQTLWEEGGVKVDMLSLALYWIRKEDQLNSSRQKKGERGQSWFGPPTLPIKKSDSHWDKVTPKHIKLTWKRICLQIIPSCGLFKSANHILEHMHAHAIWLLSTLLKDIKSLFALSQRKP